MNSILISITADTHQQESLIALLSENGAEGFEQTDDRLLAYFNELNFDSYSVNAVLHDFEKEISTVPEKNWNEEWERNFQPVIVPGFCVVRAHFHPTIAGMPFDIVITPKMSFGTGHHATTYMMMEFMEHLDFTGKKVFDFGTGTGLLAILASKKGAKEIDAIDIDEWSIENARENIERNHCAGINLYRSAELPHEKYDFILANITRNVLLDHAQQLKQLTKTEGRLLVSGLMPEDENIIVESFHAAGLQLLERKSKANWIALLFVNPNE